jgi:hypothetical protein
MDAEALIHDIAAAVDADAIGVVGGAVPALPRLSRSSLNVAMEVSMPRSLNPEIAVRVGGLSLFAIRE